MFRLLQFYLLFLTPAFFLACKKETRLVDKGIELPLNASASSSGRDTFLLPQIISQNRILSKDTVYRIRGKVFVINCATLIIEAGTTLEMEEYSFPPNIDYPSKNAESYRKLSMLIITKGSKIKANGTQTHPIIFRSILPHQQWGGIIRHPEQWGGIILLGNAPVNQDHPTLKVLSSLYSDLPDGVDLSFGGNDADDNSGSMKYCRIESGSFLPRPGQFDYVVDLFASLTLAGVGRKTVLSNVISSFHESHAFRFIGGTVRANFLIANAINNTMGFGYLFERGYTGYVQFAISILQANSSLYNRSGNGIGVFNIFDVQGPIWPPIDNYHLADQRSVNQTPKTAPILSHFTILGHFNWEVGAWAMVHGDYTYPKLSNSIILGYRYGILFSKNPTTAPQRIINNHISVFRDSSYGRPLDPSNEVYSRNRVAYGDYFDANASIRLTEPVSLYSSQYNENALVPLKNSPAFRDLNYHELPAFFKRVKYKGAINAGSPTAEAPNNWMGGSAGTWIDLFP